mgnify:CR=1 FL=1
MQRREFIKTTCLACAGTFAVSAFLAACKSSKYITNYTNENKKLSIKKSEFIVLDKGTQKTLKHILLKPAELQFPLVIYKISETEFKTLYMQCSHQGCELNAFETALVCPCHGAEFNIKGQVTLGPAENDLKTFVTTHDNENIYIQL